MRPRLRRPSRSAAAMNRRSSSRSIFGAMAALIALKPRRRRTAFRRKARRRRPRNPSPRGNSCRPRRSAHRRPSSRPRRPSMTRCPICSEVMSLSPPLSSWRTMPLTMRSTRSGSTARLRSATWTERISLSRSKGTRRPLFLMTVSSRSWTRSKVVKRPPQSGQTRRRRMAVLSSDGRESFTWVSSVAAIGTAHRAFFF